MGDDRRLGLLIEGLSLMWWYYVPRYTCAELCKRTDDAGCYLDQILRSKEEG